MQLLHQEPNVTHKPRHPDKGGSKEEFHLVYQALETLADPAARKKYDHSLATTKTGPAPHASHAPYPKEKKRKREGRHAHPTTSFKAETKTKPQTPGKKSTTFAGKAPSKPPQATATPAEPQSKQTKLLMKIRDLLKQLPRDARNDVITNQLSQRQRVVLEKLMVDNAGTSSTQGHSEVKALAAAATKIAPHQAGFESETTQQRTADSFYGSCLVALPATNSIENIAKSTEKRKSTIRKKSCATTLSTVQASDATDVKIGEGCNALSRKNSKLGPVRNKKTRSNVRKTQSSGSVMRGSHNSGSYCARIRFETLEIRTGFNRELKTALEDLVILTSVKQKILNSTAAGTFVERLQEALEFCSTQHGRKVTDLKLFFRVCHHPAGRFIGCPLSSPSVRSLEVFGKMRSVLEPFRKYAKNLGSQNVFWLYSPIHVEDAWQRFQSAVAHTWEIAGVDNTAILQKIRSLHDARAPLRSAGLQRWERQHMAMCDKNKHRPESLRERNPAARLECWERRRMAMQDKDKSRPKKCTSESPLSRKLSAVKKLVARWGHMLKSQSQLLEKQRQTVIKQQKAQQKKDKDERRRVEALNEKRRREAERSRREWVRKRMRSDLTMDDILGQKDATAFAYWFTVYFT